MKPSDSLYKTAGVDTAATQSGLHKIIERLGFERLDRKLIECRQKHDCRHPFDAAPANDFKPVDPGHLNIEKHNIGRGHVERGKHFRAVAALAGN